MYSLKRIDRRALFWMARRFYAPRTSKLVDIRQLSKILIVRIDERVGNLITLQSMIDAIKDYFGKIELGLLASSKVEQVAGSLQEVDNLHLIDKRWFFKNPGRWNQVLNSVRKTEYQIAIDASAWHVFSFTHSALSYYSGAPVRIGYQRQDDNKFLNCFVEHGPDKEHELEQRMRLVKPLGISGPAPAPMLRTSLGQDQKTKWREWLSVSESPLIGLWAGSRKMERRLSPEFYVELGQRIHAHCKGKIVLLWGPKEEELRDRLSQALPGKSIVIPQTNMQELAGIISNLDLVITNDTGPMHLSVALGRPTVALFASGEPSRWGHPYDFVKNIYTPGKNPDEIETVLAACLEVI
jgi:ADP-heptose:LPS heptosyltransferase